MLDFLAPLKALNWSRYLVYAALAAAVLSTAWVHGYSKGEQKLFDYKIDQLKASLPVVVKQGETTVKVVTEYKDRIVRIKGDTVTLTKEVLVYVKPVADPVLPFGWRVLHDAAAVGSVPAAPGGIDVTAPDVASSQALQGVIVNYGICHATSAQLVSLQNWVRHQYEVMNNKPLQY